MKTGLASNLANHAWRGLAQLALALLLLFAMQAVQAAAYNFTGGNVSGCTRNGTIYTCPSMPLAEWNDMMTIGDGYTVNIGGDVGFGYNQTLKMSGTARLTTSGALNIADVAPANLQISGGFLVAGAAFNVGNQSQTLTANISGASLYIGNGSQLTINGSLTSTGTVNLGSHTTINGSIRGTGVYTNSPVKITGNVIATSSFTLASGSNMVGNIQSPVVQILASGVTVLGNIVASTSLRLESGNKIIGDVSTGTLTLTDSAAMVDGNATVDKAILGWAGRVTKLITCRSGTTVGKCDCVVNNSGYEVNTSNGPKCDAPTPAGPSHFRVDHPGAGLSCGTPVKVYACANSNCVAPFYTGKATVTLQPGGVTVNIGDTGVADAIISSDKTSETISVAPVGANPNTCYNTTSKTSGCAITFAKSGFLVTPQSGGAVTSVITAESSHSLKISAVTTEGGTNKCVPAFNNVVKDVNLTCAYDTPAAAALKAARPVRVNGFALNTGNVATSACDTAGRTMPLSFNADGESTVPLIYVEAGKVSVTAAIPQQAMTGTATFVSAPARFEFGSLPTGGPAGRNLMPGGGAPLTAVNALGNKTQNFSIAAGAVTLDMEKCYGKLAGTFAGTLSGFTEGAGTISSIDWSEVGTIRLKAALASYLGAAVNVSGVSATGCTGAGTLKVVPDHFLVAQDPPPARVYYYSGQPIGVKVTARNGRDQPTLNYDGQAATPVNDRLALPVTIRAYLDGTTGLPSPAGTMSANVVAADAFISGVSKPQAPVYTLPAPVPPSTAPSTPQKVWLGGASSEVSVASVVKDSPSFEVRAGRLRLSNRYGFVNAPLRVPVVAEYWTGRSWLLNGDDNFTRIPVSAVVRPTGASNPVTVEGAEVILSGGRGSLVLRRAARGSADIALNLGATASHQACIGAQTSTGANLAYLRSLYGCAATHDRDPSARVGFGVFAPETRRIIHVRESFQ